MARRVDVPRLPQRDPRAAPRPLPERALTLDAIAARSRIGLALTALVACSSCSSCAAPRRAIVERAPAARALASSPAARASLRTWRFDVTASAGARELAIEAVVSAREGDVVGLESGAPFASQVEVSAGGPFQALAPARDAEGAPAFRMPACPAEGCRVRYRFALAEAARRAASIACAEESNGAFLTSPSAWLIHPIEPADDGPTFELRVAAPPGTRFVSGLLPAGSGPFALPPDAYAADVADLPNPAWAAFGTMRLVRVDEGDEAIDVAVLPGALDLDDGALRSWVSGAASAVRAYYGRASIRRVLLVIVPKPGRGFVFGRTLGNGGASIVATIGERSSLADLASGWELIHELLHVSFPKMAVEHAWLEEGMATYVEPLLRARLGLVSPEEAFAWFYRRMPYGLPERGDEGLDGTATWGRRYWGGAIFYLLADVAIRERTANQRSIDDALRAVLAAGGNVARRWDVDQLLAVGDAATGVPVLRELYAKMARAPAPVDLEGLWRRLGVRPRGETVVFDEGAELAPLRRAMTSRAPKARSIPDPR